MLKYSIGIKLLLCLPLIVISPTVSSADQTKIEGLTFFGVKLGYDPAQVIKGMTEYFSINQDELRFDKNFSQEKILAVHYSFDESNVSVYLWAENSEREIVEFTSSIVFDGKSGSEQSDKLSTTLSEFSPPSITKEHAEGNFQKTWCNTLNAAKDDCAPKSGIMSLNRQNGRDNFGIGWMQ